VRDLDALKALVRPYSIRAEGAWVVSRPCASSLVLLARPGAKEVSASATPGGACRR